MSRHTSTRFSSLMFLIAFVTGDNPTDYYYWKDYTGVIPPNALPGGRDRSGRPTYIGEAYIHHHGLFAAQIYPGQREVEVPSYGFKTAVVDVKILCTDYPEYFYWYPTSAAYFKQDFENTKALKLFQDGGHGVLNLGRIFYQGHVIVGDITIYKHPQLWFPFNKAERTSDHFEVLLFQRPMIDARMAN